MGANATSARGLALAALVLALAAARPAAAQDDVVLFSANVDPNVLIVLDNGWTMNEIVWHEDFDPTAVYPCAAFAPDSILLINNDTTLTACGRTRTLPADKKLSARTRYRGKYLNWLFSPDSDAAWLEIPLGNNAFPSSCVGGAAYGKYKRARINAAKDTIKDIICETNEVKKIRVGLGSFREDNTDPNGGYVLEPVDTYNSAQAADYTSALQSLDAETWTPLGEAMFQFYTYFMSRNVADLPLGVDGITKFPRYSYKTTSSQGGGSYVAGGTPPQVPDSPVQYSCQKNFILLITDGAPTRDDFDISNPTDRAQGFADFHKLIGDYAADGEVEEQDDAICTDCESAFYLDDIALYMQNNDFRPDMSGDQTIDTYTIGFAAEDGAEDLLRRTAVNGNGLFLTAWNADQLAAAIIAAFVDIIEKSQSFTAATVPATRTRDGGSFYTSVFLPTAKTFFWEGHLRRFLITGSGDILDKNGNCAVDDPNPGQCKSGPFLADAEPYWDAGEEIPDPGARKLYTSLVDGSGPGRVPFDTALSASDLGIATFPPTAFYPTSTALNAEGLADELIQNVRGCVLGTGVLTSDVATPQACVRRPWLLGDIFHSNPVVVGSPSSATLEPSHADFKALYLDRTRVIYAGRNDGFLSGFHAGTWQASATPPAHDPGTGEELFGFMPWVARLNVQHFPIDNGTRDYYTVDGSPTVADVWLYGSSTDTDKSADEWATVLGGGLRQGGPQYYLLDVTDPSDADYPEYRWEFPREDAPASLKDYVGQTWGEMVFTRIKVSVGGNDNSGAGFERWVAVVSGGYDPSSDPNSPAYSALSKRGRSLFMIDVKTGEVLAQKTFGTGLGEVPTMLYALASTPAVFDLDFDGFADVILAPDLGGNIWKWVVRDLGEDPINASGDVTQPSWSFRAVFSAPITTVSGTKFYKSFFFPPSATYVSGKLWIFTGSGERANVNFPGISNADENNRIYAFTDPDPLDRQTPVLPLLTEASLTNLTSTSGCPAISSRGYYIKGIDGEKWVTNSDIFGGYGVINSFIPKPPTDPCEIGGQSRLYVLRVHCGEGFFDPGTGTPRFIELGRGMPTDPRITQSPEEGGNRLIVNRQTGELINIDAPDPGTADLGILYWRELTQ
jgi:type IV pilus assembly protein PilY1